MAKSGRPRKTQISDVKVNQVAKRGRPCKTQISDVKVNQVAKRGRPRKTQISDNQVKQTAKRGRPRKTPISDNNVNQKAKRGRPRKIQISDDKIKQVAKRGRPRKTQISDNQVKQTAKRGRPRKTQISDNQVKQMANSGRPRKTQISADNVKQTAKRGRPRKTHISMNSLFTQNSEKPQQSASVSTLDGRSDLPDPCSEIINAEEPAMIQDQTELNNQVTNPLKTDKDKRQKSARRDVLVKSETTNQPQCSSHSLPTLEMECLGQAESEGEPGSGFELVSSTSKLSPSQSVSDVNLAESSAVVSPGLSQPSQSQGSIHEVQGAQGNHLPVAIPGPSQLPAQAAGFNPNGLVEYSISQFRKERTPTRGAQRWPTRGGRIKLEKRKSVENQGSPCKIRSTDVGSQSSGTYHGLVTSSNESDSVSRPECPECHLRHAKICHKKMTYQEKLTAKREVLEKAKNQTTQSENGKALPSLPVPKRKLHFGSLSSPSSSTIKYLFMKKSSTYSGALSVTPSWLGGPSTTPPRSEEPTNTPTILGEPTTTPSILEEPSTTPPILGEPTTTPSILGEPTTTPSILGEPTTTLSILGEPTTTLTILGEPSTTPPRSEEPTNTPTILGEPTTTPSILEEPSTTPPILGEPTTTPSRSEEPTNTPSILEEPSTTPPILGEPTTTLTISGEPSTTPPRSGEPTNTPSRSGETSAPPTILGEPSTTPSILGELTTTLSILGELTTTPSRSGEPSAPPTTPGQPSATLSSLREPFATPSRSREPAGTQLWLPATPPRSGESSTQPRFGEPSCTPLWSGGPSCTQENSSVPSSHNVLCSPGELVSQDPSLVLLSSQSSSGTSGYFSSPCDSSSGLVSQLPSSPKRESDSPLQSDEDSSCELLGYYEKSFGSIKHELLEDYDPPSPLY